MGELIGPLSVAITSTVFILVYSSLQWYTSSWGRSMMIMAWAILGLAANTMIWRAGGPLWLRNTAWLVVAGVYVWKTHRAVKAIRGDDDGG